MNIFSTEVLNDLPPEDLSQCPGVEPPVQAAGRRGGGGGGVDGEDGGPAGDSL